MGLREEIGRGKRMSEASCSKIIIPGIGIWVVMCKTSAIALFRSLYQTKYVEVERHHRKDG